MEKRCPRCEETKDESAFHRLKSGPNMGRLAGYCKPCEVKAQADRYRTRPEYAEARRAYHRQWMAANPEKASKWSRQKALRRRYGMTIDEYDAMLERQNGVCAACGGTSTDGRRLSVDHEHTTKRVRGLLCNHCNRAVGYLRDDPVAAAALAEYLRLHQTPPNSL
jgi:hypothetical protein